MSHFVVLLKSDLDVQQPASQVGLLNKSSRLATALSLTEFVTVIALYHVSLLCAT